MFPAPLRGRRGETRASMLVPPFSVSGTIPSLFCNGDEMQAKIEYTTRCNLDCIHCCAALYRPALDWETDQLMNVIEHLLAAGYDEFHLQGGEPFIRSDIL